MAIAQTAMGKGKSMSDSLGDVLPREMDRVTGLIEIYATIPNGLFAIALMRGNLRVASAALAH